jgi:predicted lipid carrier protein YhbT
MQPPLPPLRQALRLLPDPVHSQALALLFTHLLRGQSVAGRLGELQGKCIGIHISDAATTLSFRVHGTGLRAEPRRDTHDVTIRGTLADFWQLATRREDPDTLFFHRRLSLEGDTETGLYVKNLLDSLEFDGEAHVTAVLGPALAARILPLLARTGLMRRLRAPLGG